MKSINTLYNSNYFRSRLEARWAVFFEHAGIKYEYEPEGFNNGKNYYLPDFYLPEVWLRHKHKGVYIEIKPDIYNEESFDDKVREWFDRPLCLFKGTPDKGIWHTDDNSDNGYQIFPPWDNCMRFWKCNKCGMVKIEFSEGHYNECNFCKGALCDDFILFMAGQESVMKRFEHLH